MQIKIVSVDITRIKEGKKDYAKAQVIYTFNGHARTQNIISFANPAVFAIIEEWEQSLPTDLVEVEVGKNEKGYNEWRSIGAAGAAAPGQTSSTSVPERAGSVPKTTTFTGGRDFETGVERAARQVLIVKQSSLTAALKFHELSNDVPNLGDLLDTAQKFTDWVFEGNE